MARRRGPAALLLTFRELGWWIGHGFEIVGIAIVGIPVAIDLRRGVARSRPLLGDIKGADLVAQEEAFLGSHIRALLVALADKDAYTEEHTRRVALPRCRWGSSSGSRRSGSATSRSAAFSTTSASSASRTRS